MTITEPTSIGLSEKAHSILSQMKEDEYILELTDGYKLAIGLALANDIKPNEVPAPKRTILAVSGLDPDQEIATAIRSLVNLEGGSVYRYAERLAEWGVMEMASRFKGGFLDIASMIKDPKSKSL
jgi:hypothetical protein